MISKLIDKFNVIDNHTKKNEKSNISKIVNFVENYLNATKIFITDFVTQILWFNDINEEAIESIKEILKKFIISKRNILRENIKKEDLLLTDYILLLKGIIKKIEKMENIFSNYFSIMKISVSLLDTYILSDPYILSFLENIVVNYDKNDKVFLEELFNKLRDLTLYSFEPIKNYETNLGIMVKKNLCDEEILPLPDDLLLLQKCRLILKKMDVIDEYFDYIHSSIIKHIKQPSMSLVEDYMIEIFDKLSINQIERFLYYNKYLFLKHMDKIKNVKMIDIFNNKINTLIKNEIDVNTLLNIINSICDFNLINKHDNEIIKYIIKKNFSNFIINDDLMNKITYLIENRMTDEIIKIFDFFSYIPNNDLFLEYYYYNLIKRMIHHFSIKNETINMIKNEQHVISLVENKYEKKQFYKIKKVLTDLYNSCQYNKDIYFLQIKNLNVIVTSYDIWNVNYYDGNININNLLDDTYSKNMLSKFEEYYKQKTNKILNWYPHYGEVKIKYLDKEIIMLPLHFIILELFDKTEVIKYNDIINMSIFETYQKSYIINILNSLILSKILIKKGENLTLTITNDFEENIINIFLLNNNIIIDERIYQDICNTREDVIKTNINHYVKLNSCDKNDLYYIVSSNIKVFDVSVELFEKVLDYMIKNDYIELLDNIYYKIYY